MSINRRCRARLLLFARLLLRADDHDDAAVPARRRQIIGVNWSQLSEHCSVMTWQSRSGTTQEDWSTRTCVTALAPHEYESVEGFRAMSPECCKPVGIVDPSAFGTTDFTNTPWHWWQPAVMQNDGLAGDDADRAGSVGCRSLRDKWSC